MISPQRFISAFLLLLTLRQTLGGQCWSAANKDGRCTALLDSSVSRQDCCADGRSSTAFSEGELSSGDLFFRRSLRGGIPCQPCRRTCENVVCEDGYQCQERLGKAARCVCAPNCTRKQRRLGPVCGTDGRTYRNTCKLLKRQCRKQAALEIDYVGLCQDSCVNTKCPSSKFCVLDQQKRPHCVACNLRCKKGTKIAPVCGSDHLTHKSKCHMQEAACASGKSITALHSGPCSSSLDISTSAIIDNQ